MPSILSPDRLFIVPLAVSWYAFPDILLSYLKLSCVFYCSVQRARYMGLYRRVADACRTARLAAPLAPNFDLLAPGSPPVTVV